MKRHKQPDTEFAAAAGCVLRQLRWQLGLTQAEVARELALSQPSYSRIERGGAELTVAQLCACATRFGLQPSQLVAAIEQTLARPSQPRV